MVQNPEQRHTHARAHPLQFSFVAKKFWLPITSGDSYSEVKGCHTSKIYKEIKVTSSVVLVTCFCQKPSSMIKKSIYLQAANTELTRYFLTGTCI